MAFTSILVDIDAHAPKHPALAQAADLAARCGAHLTIADVLPEVPRQARQFLTDQLEEELAAHRRQCLARLADTTGVPTNTVLLRGRAPTALVRQVLDARHDLVVRSHVRDLAGPRRPLGVVDMELLRLCPCPVWLIGPGGTARPQRILAAVRASTDDAAEQRLNAAIVELALMLTDVEKGSLTVVETWSLFGEDVLRPHMPEPELAAQVAAARQQAEDTLQAFVASFGERAQAASVELLKGYPDDVIPPFVEANAIDVVVMGTVARTGIAGLLMGNTAERVLRRLHGSVLALKPPGFVSPLAAEGMKEEAGAT